MKALVEFCRQHGTPKLKAASDERVAEYLDWAEIEGFLVLVKGPGERIEGLGVAWPCDFSAPTRPATYGQTLYVANLACPSARALCRVLNVGACRWPKVRSFAGHRGDLLVSYGLRHVRLLYRLATKGKL
ncbi:MAG TPA: hypothetical protein VIY86_12865 [Pirellulaceae bacterium]